MSDEILRNISDNQIDAKSPLSEDLMARYRDNARLNQAHISSHPGLLLEGAIDSVSTTQIVDADPTAGEINHDDKFNGLYLHFKNGTVFTNNNRNRFKILDTDAGTDTLTLDTDVQALGASAGDLYEILGHTQDGVGPDKDGEKVDLKHLTNVASDQDMSQDLADAITDPNNVRGGAGDAADPFAPISAVRPRVHVIPSPVLLDTAIDGAGDCNGTPVGFQGTKDISGSIPAGTRSVFVSVEVTNDWTSCPNPFGGYFSWRNVASGGVGFDATDVNLAGGLNLNNTAAKWDGANAPTGIQTVKWLFEIPVDNNGLIYRRMSDDTQGAGHKTELRLVGYRHDN